MDVMQAIRERRSIRKYSQQQVSNEILNSVFEAARWAPSWANTQCWKFVVVRDQKTKSQLADSLTSVRSDVKNAATEAVRNAPVVIVVCGQRGLSGCYRSGDREGMPATDKGEWWLMFDVGLTMQNMTLMAHTLGLGTVHVGMFDTEEVRRILNIPENITIVEIMPLGWPAEEPQPRPRKDINEFIFYERYLS